MILLTVLIGVILVLLLVWFRRQDRRDVPEPTGRSPGPVDAAAAHWAAALAASRAQARTPHGRRTDAASTGFGGPSPFYSSPSWAYEAPADSACSTDGHSSADSSRDSGCSSDSSSGRSD